MPLDEMLIKPVQKLCLPFAIGFLEINVIKKDGKIPHADRINGLKFFQQHLLVVLSAKNRIMEVQSR